MNLEPHAFKILQKTGIKRCKTVLDFGCSSGTYTIPAAKIAGEEGKVYALDKDKKALDKLMQKAESAGLENVERIDTSGELKISANFYPEREYSGTLIHDNEDFEKGKVLNFRKRR